MPGAWSHATPPAPPALAARSSAHDDADGASGRYVASLARSEIMGW